MTKVDKKALMPMDEYEKELIDAIESDDIVLKKPTPERLDMLQKR